MESFYSKQKEEEEEEEEEVIAEPVSPTGLYLNSSFLSVSILSVLEFQTPITEHSLSLVIPMLKDVFLPINPRFSSIIVSDKNGLKQWKEVEVKLEDHIHIPIYPSGLPPKSYDEYLDIYLTKLAMEKFPQSKPLWELHIFKYPTSNNATGNLIFKLNHALGDGYSLMGALLSCLQKADNDDPNAPLTFPHFQRRSSSLLEKDDKNVLGVFKNVPRVFSSVFNTISDFGSSVLKSSMVEDDWSPIRSGKVGVEVSPMIISTISFSLDHIKQIKTKLGVTVNDVISGVIFLGIRLYMQAMNHSSSNLQSTALVCLNTREISGYTTLEEMKKPNNKSIWGNQFCFLHVPIPELNTRVEHLNPVDFIMEVQKNIQRKRSSLTVYLNGWFLQVLRKLKGPEVTSKYVYSTIRNASLAISNMIGPVEQLALANHLVKGMYFLPIGAPVSLIITVISYMGELRVAVGTERDHIDSKKFKSCIENSFNMMLKATCNPPRDHV